MDVIKIEKVIVGDEMRPMPVEEILKPAEEIPQHVMVLMSPCSNGVEQSDLKCDHCFITFSNPKSHDRHMKKHHKSVHTQQLQMENILFSCYKCDKSFTSSEKLREHHLTHKQEEKPFKCAPCNQRFSTLSERYQHRRHDCDKRRNYCKRHCVDCGSFFTSLAQLRNHSCKCDCGFQKGLQQHTSQCANHLDCDATARGKDCSHNHEHGSSEGQESSVVLQIPCSEEDCDLIFSSIDALREHKREVHPPPPKKSRKSR